MQNNMLVWLQENKRLESIAKILSALNNIGLLRRV
jgi:hypothetical protein